MSIDINKLDKINTELITPTVNENIIETERDKWGNILNEKTFKTLNNNIKFLKDIISEIINNINILNLDDIKLRLKNIETDTTKLESLININEQRTDITTGINTSNYNIVGNGEHLKYNGKDLARLDEVQNISSPIDTTNFAKLNTSNTFTQKIKGTDIESNKLITQELILNGVNVDLNDYTTNNNLISQLEKIIGLTYGGDIQNTNAKVVGKFYYDNINKYFYECIVNNNLTYIDNTKFKAISNKPLSDSLGSDNNSLEIKIYTKTELLKLYRKLETFIVDIVLIIYGKLAIYSGYFINSDMVVNARFEDKLCIFPVKAKHIMWGSDNLQVMNIGERCILKTSNYFHTNGLSTCFQGVFIIE